MPEKLGNGGNSLEKYNPEDGKYIADGKPNKYYDNPAEKQKKYRPQLTQMYGETALKQIQEDINVDEESAKYYQNAFYQYTGGNSALIKSGDDFDVYYIEDYINKAPVYDGEIYRGLRFFDNDEKAKNFVKQLQKGSVIDMGGISSWTSSQSVARLYSGGINNDDYAYKIMFILKNNKSGVGIQHLSLYGSEEEVLQSSKTKFKIFDIEINTLNHWKQGKEYKVYVDEV